MGVCLYLLAGLNSARDLPQKMHSLLDRADDDDDPARPACDGGGGFDGCGCSDGVGEGRRGKLDSDTTAGRGRGVAAGAFTRP